MPDLFNCGQYRQVVRLQGCFDRVLTVGVCNVGVGTADVLGVYDTRALHR